MNVTEHLLATLAEECGEVSKECHKALRFGLDDHATMDPSGPPGTAGLSNREKIICELNDVLGAAQLLVEHGILPVNWQNAHAQEQKVRKVIKFFDYAERVGALEFNR